MFIVYQWWMSVYRKQNIDLYPLPYTKLNLRLINRKRLKVKEKTLKHLEELRGEHFHDIG